MGASSSMRRGCSLPTSIVPQLEQESREAGILQSFFARNRKPAETKRRKDLHASSVLQKVVEVISGEPAGLAFVYETAGGLRVILAHRKIDPCSAEAARTLDFHWERSALPSPVS
jgi:hypothetical protein